MPEESPTVLTDQDIKRQVEAILASSYFAGSERLGSLLRFICERSRSEDTGRLKEVSIGGEVFGRPAGYDPKTDPIVRTEARRLRKKLDEYYQSAGGRDGVRISIPKGAYVAYFERLPSESKRRTRVAPKLLISAAMLLTLLAFLSATAISRRLLPRFAPVASPSASVRNLTSYRGDEESPTFSPDGSQVAFSWNGERQNNTDIYVVLSSGGPPRRLTEAAEPDVHPVWSPDGSRIAFIRNWRDVILISPLGGSERKVAETNYYFMSWSPDGSTLAVARHQQAAAPYAIYGVSVDTGRMQQMTFPPANTMGDVYPAFSPDGQFLASVRCRSASCELYVTPADGGAARQVTNDRAWIRGVAWTADGRELVFSSDRRGFYNLWRVSAFSPGEPQQVVGTGDDEYYPTVGRAIHGRSRLAFEHRAFDTNIWEIDAGQANAPKAILASTRIDSSPQFSPDGNKIAFVSDRMGRLEIWTAEADGSNAAQLTFLKSEECGSPHWSPDGKQIVFDALREEGRGVFVVPETGGEPQRVFLGNNLGRPSWSRDGRWIYFYWDGSGSRQLWKIAPGGGQPVQVTSDGGYDGAESVDGKTIYYVRDFDLVSMPSAGGPSTVILKGMVHDGWWSVTQRGIYFVDVYAGKPAGEAAPKDAKPIRFYDFETRKTTRVDVIHGALFLPRPDFTASADGKRILYAELDVSNIDIRILDDFR